MSARRRTAYVEIDRFYARLAQQTIDAAESKRYPSRRAARRAEAEAKAEAVLWALVLARGSLRNTWRGAHRATSPPRKEKNMTLLDLAREFDRTTDLDARIALAEQIRPLLGDAYEEFDRRHEALLNEGFLHTFRGGICIHCKVGDGSPEHAATVGACPALPKCPNPATQALEKMGYVPIHDGQARGFQCTDADGFVKQIEVSADVPGATLASLFHGAWNLAPHDPAFVSGRKLPCCISVGRIFHAGIDTSYLITAPANGVARIKVVLTEPDEWYAARQAAGRLYQIWRPGTPCPKAELAVRDYVYEAHAAILSKNRPAAAEALRQAEETAKAADCWHAAPRSPIAALVEDIRAALPKGTP